MTLYDREFYAQELQGSLDSARAIVPCILKYIQPRSVVDIGCGVATWLSVFKEHGVGEILGVDGGYVDRTLLLIPESEFLAHDLTRPLRMARTFDLAVSLEVAEHLPAESAGMLVQTLTQLAPVVLFSAAIPLQGGLHHVNEQWPVYWADRFAERGFQVVDCLRRDIWNLPGIKPHYAQNAFFYVNADRLSDFPALQVGADGSGELPLPLVHPGIFEYRVRTLTAQKELRPGNFALSAILASLPALAAYEARVLAKRVLGRVLPGLLEAVRTSKRDRTAR